MTQLDAKNKNTLWCDAVSKEMQNVPFAYRVLDIGEEPILEHVYVGLHMIYSVKMDFTWKTRLVADGHKTPNPTLSTYMGVVSCERAIIGFLYAALNDLEIMDTDIRNAYL